jgi:hypothetical protein
MTSRHLKLFLLCAFLVGFQPFAGAQSGALPELERVVLS